MRNPLPIRSNRISWKRLRDLSISYPVIIALPIRSNRISWKLTPINIKSITTNRPSLPIRSNRISWKRIQHDAIKRTIRLTLYPYLLGQIGLVGNSGHPVSPDLDFLALPIRSNRISWKLPYRLQDIGGTAPYLLGQIGLVGN